MSPAANRKRECDAALAVAREAYQSEVSINAENDASEAAKRKQLESAEAAYADSALSMALGDGPSLNLPDAQAMEHLRAEIRVADIVRQQLEMRTRSARLAVTKAEREAKQATHDLLHEAGLSPALQDFHNAFEALGAAALRLQAAHYTVYKTHGVSNVNARSFLDFYGPAAELVETLINIDWPNKYPYDVRPAWLKHKGRYLPDGLPGMKQALLEMESIVQKELTA